MPLRTRLFSPVVAVFLLTISSTYVAQAQTAPPPPGEGRPPVVRGDIVWAFAQEDPLFDERVATALGSLMAPKIEAAVPAGARIVRVEQQEPGIFPSGMVAPAADVPLLLAAAGFGQTPPFVEVGQCKVWVGTPSDDIESAITPAEAEPIITVALQESLAALGVESQRCAVTSNAAEAHLLVWVAYGPAPELAMRPQSTFLAGTGVLLPGTGSGGTGGGVPGDAPQPAVTGNGGLSDASGSAGRAIGVLIVSCVLFVLGSRRATRGARRWM